MQDWSRSVSYMHGNTGISLCYADAGGMQTCKEDLLHLLMTDMHERKKISYCTANADAMQPLARCVSFTADTFAPP